MQWWLPDITFYFSSQNEGRGLRAATIKEVCPLPQLMDHSRLFCGPDVQVCLIRKELTEKNDKRSKIQELIASSSSVVPVYYAQPSPGPRTAPQGCWHPLAATLASEALYAAARASQTRALAHGHVPHLVIPAQNKSSARCYSRCRCSCSISKQRILRAVSCAAQPCKTHHSRHNRCPADVNLTLVWRTAPCVAHLFCTLLNCWPHQSHWATSVTSTHLTMKRLLLSCKSEPTTEYTTRDIYCIYNQSTHNQSMTYKVYRWRPRSWGYQCVPQYGAWSHTAGAPGEHPHQQ